MSDWTVVDHLTDWLLRPRVGQSKHPTLWPSEASAVITNKYDEEQVVGKCRRARYFRFLSHCYGFYDKYSHMKPLVDHLKKVKIPPDRYMLWIWKAGELYEEYVIDAAKGSGIYWADQVPLYMPEYNISGKVDLVIINPETHKLSQVEVKSVYGFGGTAVLGTPSQQRKGNLGTPRDSNLMQIALYEWWGARQLPEYEHSRLLYGSRDTGRYAEYRIKTTQVEGESTHVHYKGLSPVAAPANKSLITIESILAEYKGTQDAVDNDVIPPRDFDASYSEEKIKLLCDRGELSKKDAEQVTKRKARDEDNLVRVADGKPPLKELKPVEKGDWQCRFCAYKNACYEPDGSPKDL